MPVTVKKWTRRWWQKIKPFLSERMSPHQQALALSFALLWGTIPLLGPVSLLGLMSCWFLRLSVPLVLGAIWMLTPLQVVLALPFRQLGAWWFPASRPDLFQPQAEPLWWEMAGTWQMQALEAWAAIMIPLASGFYFWWLRRASRAVLHAPALGPEIDPTND